LVNYPQRLISNFKEAQEKMTHAFHENLILRQKCNELEDKLDEAANIQDQLHKDINHERLFRVDHESLVSKIQELQRDLGITKNNLQEIKEENFILKKVKNDYEKIEIKNAELVDEVLFP
jgi:hypothetical protein